MAGKDEEEWEWEPRGSHEDGEGREASLLTQKSAICQGKGPGYRSPCPRPEYRAS